MEKHVRYKKIEDGDLTIIILKNPKDRELVDDFLQDKLINFKEMMKEYIETKNKELKEFFFEPSTRFFSSKLKDRFSVDLMGKNYENNETCLQAFIEYTFNATYSDHRNYYKYSKDQRYLDFMEIYDLRACGNTEVAAQKILEFEQKYPFIKMTENEQKFIAKFFGNIMSMTENVITANMYYHFLDTFKDELEIYTLNKIADFYKKKHDYTDKLKAAQYYAKTDYLTYAIEIYIDLGEEKYMEEIIELYEQAGDYHHKIMKLLIKYDKSRVLEYTEKVYA